MTLDILYIVAAVAVFLTLLGKALAALGRAVRERHSAELRVAELKQAAADREGQAECDRLTLERRVAELTAEAAELESDARIEWARAELERRALEARIAARDATAGRVSTRLDHLVYLARRAAETARHCGGPRRDDEFWLMRELGDLTAAAANCADELRRGGV